MIVWLSFIDPSKPEGTKFLGVVIVEFSDADVEVARAAAPNLKQWDFAEAATAAAITKSWIVGANPGGECQAYSFPDQFAHVVRPHLNKLLTKAEADAITGDAVMAPHA